MRRPNALQWLADAGPLTWTKALLVLDAFGCKACPRAVEDLGPAMKMCSSNNVVRAATKGQVDVLVVARTMSLELRISIAGPRFFSTEGGHLNVAQFVVAHRLGVCDDVYVNVAAKSGHFELLEYLLCLGYDGVN